jgi:hypothetical protein
MGASDRRRGRTPKLFFGPKLRQHARAAFPMVQGAGRAWERVSEDGAGA